LDSIDTGVKAQGPQGNKGEDAKVSIKGAFDDKDSLENEWATYISDSENYEYGSGENLKNKFLNEVTIGDGYIVEDTGHL
jgi:hypothetical protein